MGKMNIVDLARKGMLLKVVKQMGIEVDLDQLEVLEDFLDGSKEECESCYAMVGILNCIFVKFYEDNLIEHGESVFDMAEAGCYSIE